MNPIDTFTPAIVRDLLQAWVAEGWLEPVNMARLTTIDTGGVHDTMTSVQIRVILSGNRCNR